MKKAIKLIIITLFLITGITTVSALEQPTQEYFVNDFADILSPETEKYILEKSRELQAKDGTEIVVVTLKEMNGVTVTDYANDIYQAWNIGSKSKDNGILILITMEERKFSIQRGSGLKEIIPDETIEEMQEKYIVPYLEQKKWEDGIKNGYNAVFSKIVNMRNLELEFTLPTDVSADNSGDNISKCFFIAAIGVIIAIFLGKHSTGIAVLYMVVSDVYYIYSMFHHNTSYYGVYMAITIVSSILIAVIIGPGVEQNHGSTYNQKQRF